MAIVRRFPLVALLPNLSAQKSVFISTTDTMLGLHEGKIPSTLSRQKTKNPDDGRAVIGIS